MVLLIMPMRVATFRAASLMVPIARPASLILGGVKIVFARLFSQMRGRLLLIAVVVLGTAPHAGELDRGATMAVSLRLMRHVRRLLHGRRALTITSHSMALCRVLQPRAPCIRVRIGHLLGHVS